jgi:hypothetical protein
VIRLAATLLLLVAATAHAEEARTYAIVSLLGDRLAIVSPVITTGSNLDRSLRDYIKLDTPALDHAALLATDGALREADPAAKEVMLLVRDAAIYEAQVASLEDGKAVASLVPRLAGTLSGAHATHLVLLTKLRHDAAFPTDQSHVGQGRLEGLGFYVDRMTRLYDLQSGDDYAGFLGPYAYFRLSLLDLGSGKVLAQKDVSASQTWGMHSAVHPWEELTAQRKINAIQSMLRSQIAEGIPVLLAAPR